MENENKLELKHLAPYIPYGLHIKHNDGARLIICGAFKKYNADDFFYYSLLNWMTDVKSFDSKPILRPLSDLVKEINYGLSSYAFVDLFEVGDCDGCCFEFEHGNIKTINLIESISKNSSYHDINYLPNAVVNMMIEYHFDIFGLIDLGLAIDINSLKSNESKTT